MQEPQPVPERWKPLTDEQIDDMVEAFNELQVTGHYAAIIGQSGNIAVEIREGVVDPDTLAFIMDVADRHQLRPYIFRTEHNAPIVLQPLRELAEGPPEPEAASADVVQFHEPADPPADDTEPQEAAETAFRLAELPNAVMLTIPVAGLDEDDWPAAHFTFETTAEREIAREVAEQAGQLAAARVTDGAAPAHALAEAYEVGIRRFEQAKTTLAADA